MQERTNITAVNHDGPSPEISACSIYSPNTSLTFARTNPTANRPRRTSSKSRPGTDTSLRNRRYSAAEQALSDALQRHNGEVSPRELQIRTLRQASAALSARALQSQERVAKLRLRLADRDASPDVYSAMQRERWMEEKRQSMVDRQVNELTQHLASLQANRDRGRKGDSSAALGNEARRRANLARFFDSSPTRTSFRLNLKCRLALDQSFPRRMTMNDVSPLRLRPSSVTPPLRRLTTKHARPVSMGNDLFNPIKRPSKPRIGNSHSEVPPFVKGAESSSPKTQSVSERSSQSGSSRLAANSVASTSDDNASIRPPTPPLSITSEGSSSVLAASGDRGGMATIISHVSPRTRAEILADFNQDDVHVPDYALNLLGNLDLIHDKFSLPDRDLFVKPREMKPIDVAPPPAETPPPSEESDTGPYTSFALPPFAMEPSWSHISLTSPPSPSTPRMQRTSLQPLKSGSSSPSRSSTPTTPRTSTRTSTKTPRNRQSLLFYMRKHKSGFGEDSPASSISRIDPLPENATVSKKRFSLFSRK
ncbi:hypothetical protein F5I97DRAFT_1499536 [Phlebopus sp. FC_14]|nr:hypothetical protein F5I97DRAFT_1499536 [Phlebopus sp. FC_14]